ncbi:hypothetical protein D6745_00560, partial [Candidatus Woesearchaeota archaeon]
KLEEKVNVLSLIFRDFSFKEKIRLIPLLALYYIPIAINQPIQLIREVYFKMRGIPYKWVCSDDDKDDVFFDQLRYCVRTDKPNNLGINY